MNKSSEVQTIDPSDEVDKKLRKPRSPIIRVEKAQSEESMVIRAYLKPGETQIREKDLLPKEMLNFTFERRPLTWQDVETIRTQLARSKREMVFAMVFQSQGKYHERVSSPRIMPVTDELLLRAYMELPGDCTWAHPEIRPDQTFEIYYGDILRKFKESVDLDAQLCAAAQVALQRRFAKLLGRSFPTSYRWLDAKNANFNPVVRNIVLKSLEATHPRQFIEDLATQVWALRGVDLNLEAPMPTRKPKLYGRKPVSLGERQKKVLHAESASDF